MGAICALKGGLYLYLTIIATSEATYNPFGDNIPFSIQWPGADPELEGVPNTDGNSIVIMTNNNEKYRCSIPDAFDGDSEIDISAYAGPSEMELLQPLFSQTSCSYRIESYWTYELCHGKHLRQYHEEKELNQKPKLQEYYLGLYGVSPSTTAEPVDTTASTKTAESETKQAPLKKVEGVEIPYYEVQFEDGTTCDLTGRPRRAAMQYVCQPEGTGEIYEHKETYTCEYEVVVLTNLLCAHPLYQVKKDPINQIKCHSLGDSPSQPRSLRSMEAENKQSPYNRQDKSSRKPTKPHVSYKPATKKPDTKTAPSTTSTTPSKSAASPTTTQTTPTTKLNSNTGQLILNNFLSGENCIQGGTGWWKHEICLGKRVIQFHQDKSKTGEAVGQPTVVTLGTWSETEHKAWLRDNPNKRPPTAQQVGVAATQKKKYVNYYYGGGDICDLTGKPRYVEVKVKCIESVRHPQSISIYLIEPAPCTYTLVVESQLFCDIIDMVDEDGLFITKH